MAADLKNSSSALIGRVAAKLLTTSEATIWEMPTDVGGDLILRLTNRSNEGGAGAAAKAYISLIDPAQAVSDADRIQTDSLAPGESVDIPVSMAPGQFLSGKAETAAYISAVVHGVSFTSTTAASSGIHLDAVGTGGYTSGSTGALTTVSGTNKVGTSPHRKVTAALLALPQTGASSTTGYGTYSTFGVTCAGAAMTQASATDVFSGTTRLGSISIWEYADPTSGSNPTITASVQKAALAFNLVLLTISEYGIGAAGAVSIDAPTSAAALNVSVASADGHRVLFVGAFNDPPNRLLVGGLNAVGLSDGNASPGTTRPHWLYLAWAAGASTVAAATDNSDTHGGILLDRPAA